jgi:peptidoglycan hydrolase-like protein with peptidoglycan-binding domain
VAFSKNFNLGSRDTDVKKLQQYLNSHGFPVSSSGFGSRGQETTYFGEKTKAALVKFQEAYADFILKPYGLTKGTGFFGVKTREYINAH